MLFPQTALLALAILPFSLAQISNDFESGWDQTLWPIYAPDCNSGGTVTWVNNTAHSGTHSMEVYSPGGYCGHIFFGTTAVPTGDVYVRVWLKATTALTADHVSFIIMPDSAEGSDEHLRIGGQDEILMYNRQVDDATLPDLSPDGVASSEALPTGAWECFEYYLGTDGSIATWLNSVAIAGLTTGAANAYDDQWESTLIIPTITGVYFGWESYGSDANTFWYDDVSIQSSRVGCGASVSSVSATSATTSSTSTSSSKASSSTGSSKSASSSTAKTTSTTTTTSSVTTTSTASGATQTHYGQCGGIGWTGPTTCASPYTCTFSSAYYSQCL